VELTFRETLPSDVEEMFLVRARTGENPISKVLLFARSMIDQMIHHGFDVRYVSISVFGESACK
jgi:hypothetical protein